MASGFFCLDNRIPNHIFFPDREDAKTLEHAQKYCDQCERWKDCVDIALRARDEWGYFGGMNYEQRRKYMFKEALKEGKASSLPQKTSHVQQHPVYVSPVFLSHIPYERIHNPLVSQMVVEERSSFQVTLPKFV